MRLWLFPGDIRQCDLNFHKDLSQGEGLLNDFDRGQAFYPSRPILWKASRDENSGYVDGLIADALQEIQSFEPGHVIVGYDKIIWIGEEVFPTSLPVFRSSDKVTLSAEFTSHHFPQELVVLGDDEAMTAAARSAAIVPRHFRTG